MKIPALATDQMREVDRFMNEAYGNTLLQMIVNAGRNLADMASSSEDPSLCWLGQVTMEVGGWWQPAICIIGVQM